MHTFRGGPTGWPGVTSALTDQQAARPAPVPAAPAASGPVVLDDGDRALLSAPARDGRAAHAGPARATGWHEATVRRRIAQLRASGALYFDIDVDDRLLGCADPSLLWISVEPAPLDAAGREPARHPEVSFAAAATGPTNLLASVLCRDVHARYDYIANRAGALPGILGIETVPVIRTVKRAGMTDRG